MWMISGLLFGLFLFKALGQIPRLIEVTNRDGYEAPSTTIGWLRNLLRGAPPLMTEVVVTVAVFLVWAIENPLRAWLRRARRPPERASGEGIPIILIHGYFLTPWTMAVLWWRLKSTGRPLYLLDYYPALGDIDRFVAQLAELVSRVCPPERPVDLVAHSMGGLIAARYIGQNPGRVRRLVAVGTPFGGTRTWALSPGHSVRQMRPGCDFLKTTVTEGGFPGDTRVTSIYSTFDQTIVPFDSSRLEMDGAENVVLDGIGHTVLPVHPKVAARVRRAVDD
ncbi:MAG: alpha/beta fold hydrolase [Nitrospirota bacterium]|nr:alpha/beta fold hydrolase [Nitrospirota bacterium]